MRKLKLQMQISVNGFVCGPNGEMDWMVWNWDEELNKYVTELTEPVDLIILGRKLAQGFIPYWANAAKNPDSAEYAGAEKMAGTPKIVFSKTLGSCDWENTKLANGDIVDEITALKKQPGNDIIVYGGAEFVSNLISKGLIDEYHLFVNPTAVSEGMSIFKTPGQKVNLKLMRATSFDCGIVALFYKQ